MKKKFYLPGLYSRSKKDVERDDGLGIIVNQIDSTTPLLNQFIHSTSDFYRENFNEIEGCKRREKRLLEFETPNRAKITHEYDISLAKGFDFDRYYYLFNPRNRLSWLKIRQEGKRILIADNATIKSLVKEKLDKEISENISQEESNRFYEYIWKNQQGYPCFIILDKTDKTNILLEAEYFDSVKSVDEKNNFFCRILCPFEERSILYEYEPLRKYSSWLYVRAPKDFNIVVNKKKIGYNSDENQIDFYDDEKNKEHSDPEIKTLTIVNKNNNQNPIVKLDIDIEIPSSRKIWFKAVYWTSLILCVILGLNLINKIWVCIKPLFYTSFNISDLADKIDLTIILSVIAGIITTRGWLISEETIFERYSKYLTWILILLILFWVSRKTCGLSINLCQSK